MTTAEAAREDDIRTIRAMDRQFMDGVAAKDAERIAMLYAEDARIMMPHRPAIIGRSGILAFYQAALQGLVKSILLETTDVAVSGDLAYAIGNNRIALSPPGEAPREERGKYVAVYRRTSAAGWEIVIDSYSNDE
jgi:uncharacterized protein (TIGR02246 family)